MNKLILIPAIGAAMLTFSAFAQQEQGATGGSAGTAADQSATDTSEKIGLAAAIAAGVAMIIDTDGPGSSTTTTTTTTSSTSSASTN